MKKLIVILIAVIFTANFVFAQEDTTKTSENAKTGFNFGALPVVAYNSDIGFQYGALANIYHYGDGSRYPAYDHSLYVEWSRSTKGNGRNVLQYDSEMLIPNMRVTAEASYLTEKAINFYGFNGYNSYYNANYENQEHENGISRMFYRHERKIVKLKADFQGNIIGKKLRWIAGATYLGTEIAPVNITELNEGKEEDLLPDVRSLYDLYTEWGVIKDSEKNGGNNTFLKVGAVFDTRDNEPNPNKGMWTEALILFGPSFLGYENNLTQLVLLHRQYFTLVPERLTFAYRLSYKTKLSGDNPFYLQPYHIDSKDIRDGFGGSKTLRGILRNRVVGDGVAFGNFEARWKVLKTKFLKQNFYIALSAFADAGRVVDPYGFDTSNVPVNVTLDGNDYSTANWFNAADESWHISYGVGVHFALNENFIVAVDYGMANIIEDGTSGLYIGLNFLY